MGIYCGFFFYEKLKMLRTARLLTSLPKQLNTMHLDRPKTSTIVSCDLSKTGFCGSNLNFVSKQMHLSLPRNKMDDRRVLIGSAPVKGDGTEGEKTVSIDSLIVSREDMFPNEDTPKMLINGVPFCEIPIVNIRVSRNNTIVCLTDPKTGAAKLIRSCGIEGYKNTRKGTNIAAQATAISFSAQALNRGYKTVRVRVQGLGPGRMSSIKGLEMGGLNIVSVTDSTRVSWNPPRPRKQRTL